MIVRTASGPVECTAFIRTPGGLVECGDAKFRGPAALVSIGSVKALSASASPDNAFGATESRTSQRVQTNYVEAKPVGGKAPYSYAWTGTGGAMSATNPTAATTAFAGNVGPGSSDSSSFICTVTDATGKTAQTNAVEATIENYGGGGGNINLQ